MKLCSTDILGPDGLVAQKLDSYEPREQQLEMACATEEAFADGEHLLVEAGTGVGKSFAYLVPAILQVLKHKRRIVVSTYTIALQQQLIEKDIPFLSEIMGGGFKAVLGKGRRNYLCTRRLKNVLKNHSKFFSARAHIAQLEQLAVWAMHTPHGSLQELDFQVAPQVWDKVCAESGMCQGRQCKYHGMCHLQHARAEMQAADILVINHALFFSDLVMQAKQAKLLGDYDLVILDEAHTVEQVAGDHFGASVTSTAVNFLLRELYNPGNDRGLLALIEDDESIKAVKRAHSASNDFFDALINCRPPAVLQSGRITQANIVNNSLSPALNDLSAKLRRLRETIDNEETKQDLLALELRSKEFADNTDKLLAQSDEHNAYWLNSRRTGKSKHSQITTLACAPIDVAPMIRQLLFHEVGSCVLTSATLATSRAGQHGFDYIRKRLGMDEGRELLLTSPFDYSSQARLYVETRLGNPNHLDTFASAAADTLEYYIEKSQGRCFVLCTSYAMLDRLANEIAMFCNDNDYQLLVQGQELSRSAMLNEFRKHPRSVLMGTMSFWQGVDVAGQALSNVVITKLPFAAPNDPIVEARIDSIKKSGGNPFTDYQLPEAVIRFKQGFGRLIRTKSDTGFVVVLDERIVTKAYGKMFTNSLPDIPVITNEFCGNDCGTSNINDDLWEYM